MSGPSRNAELRCRWFGYLRLYMEKRQQRHRSDHTRERVEPRCYRGEMPIGLRLTLALPRKDTRIRPPPDASFRAYAEHPTRISAGQNFARQTNSRRSRLARVLEALGPNSLVRTRFPALTGSLSKCLKYAGGRRFPQPAFGTAARGQRFRPRALPPFPSNRMPKRQGRQHPLDVPDSRP